MTTHDPKSAPPGATTADDTVARYEAALAQLESRGIDPRGRFEQFQSALGELRAGKRVDQVLLSQAFLDLFQLAHIVEQLGGSNDPVLRSKLKLVMHDPGDPRIGADTPGRDAQSELFLAAGLASRGVHVTFEEPDLVAHIDSLYFGLAVKRPKAIKGLDRNLRRAIGQLSREGSTLPSITHGVPAIDITLLANRGGLVAVSRDARSAVSAADQLLDTVAEHIAVTDVMSTLLAGKGEAGVRLCCGVLLFGAVTQYGQFGGVTNSAAFRMLRLGSSHRGALDLLANAVRST